MSFSKLVKQEILDKEQTDDNCMLSFLSGLLKSCATYNEDHMWSVSLSTEMKKLTEVVDKICQKLYGEGVSVIKYDNYHIKQQEYYTINFSVAVAKQMLMDTSCIKLEDGKLEKTSDIDHNLLKEEETLKSFVAGVFVGCGTSSISINKEERQTTGYHLEFASKYLKFLQQFSHILEEFEIKAKLIKRKKNFVLYVKDCFEVSNVLALVSAYNAVFELQNEMAIRELRNKANRQTNCTSANIAKTVNASIKQNDAIAKIMIKYGLDSLDKDLQNVALLRMANPDESLDELIKIASFEITKSALNYRLNKIIKIADTIL